MNFDKYTDRSKGFIQSAQSLALREGHQQFTPEHLLKVLLDGRVPFPVIEAKFALVLQRDIKARGGAGRPAFIEPLVGRSIGIKRHAVSGVDEAMSREKTGLTRTDDGDVPHCPSHYLCGR